jgi:hypothetical protein
MLGMQKRAELTGGWAAKDWSWQKYRNSCGEAGEAAKVQALRQSCDRFDGRRRRRGRAILVWKPQSAHSPNTGQKKGSQNYWGDKDGALSETAKFGPLFLAAASLSPTWVWLRLGRLSQPGKDPPEVINPVVTVHTRGPKRNQRRGMFCGIIPTIL